MYHHCAFAVVQVATEPVTKTIEGCVLAATLAEGGITRAMKVTHTRMHTPSAVKLKLLNWPAVELTLTDCMHG